MASGRVKQRERGRQVLEGVEALSIEVTICMKIVKCSRKTFILYHPFNIYLGGMEGE